WEFPSGALLSGLFVAMILSPREPWHVAAVTSAVAIVSKYVVRTGAANVFNPAALALVVSYYAFDTAQNWWGALPELPAVAIIVLLATGGFIAQRVNKIPAVLSFLGAYFLLATVLAFAGDPARVAELYRAPDLHAALFLALFMVTDPPTSPPKQRDQVVFGVITGTVSFAAFELVGAVYFLLAGVLVANVWEAVRRYRARGKRRATTRP
ncbi:MAG TPA: RnfABCDGE type electron transport complex subunit D, partial [Gemmatimonadaceae bacterium]|nr:RnfABCDGE type electron transport complex subunit D [Gemmatimonadaceae bacterium]